MTKTIEEAAREYAAKLNYSMEAKHNMRPCDFEIAFCDGANYVFNLPLASRLTDEEKEKIRANYADAKDIHARCVGTMSKNHIADLHNEYNKGLNMGIMIALKHYFGADFFKEGE